MAVIHQIFWASVLVLITGCSTPLEGLKVTRGHEELTSCENDFTNTLQINYLGAGGYLMKCGTNSILTAPFFSNPSFFRVSFLPLKADTNAIERLLPDVDDIQTILVGHSHYDHLLDLPYILTSHAKKATVYGNRTMVNLLANIVPNHLEALETKAGDFTTNGHPGEWIYVSNHRIRFMALKSMHAPHFMGIKYFSGEARKPVSKLPSSAWGWKEGQTLAFVIDFLKEDQRTIDHRIFYQDAAVDCPPFGYLPHFKDVSERKDPDIAILCMASYHEAKNYPEGVINGLHPRKVIVGHWEDFFTPQIKTLNVVRATRSKQFANRLRKAVPEECIIVPAPGAWYRF